MRRPTAFFAAIGLMLVLAVPSNASAQADDSWFGWLGCWELLVDEDSDEPIEGTRRVCVERVERGVTLTTMVDDREVLRRLVASDGFDRDVETGGCMGSERAWWSADGNRLLVSSDLVCEGGRGRQTSGVSLLVSRNRWTDIQVANVDGQREVLVRRYRRVASAEAADTRDLSLATATARQAAAAPIDLEDVLEATEQLDPAVVETLLLESTLAFHVNADALMLLAGADVPGNIVDLMVALSYPDYFAIGDDSEQGQLAEGGVRFAYAYPVSWYGYWSYGFAPFGWGYYHYPSHPIYGRPTIYGGKAVNGRGYTRVQAKPNLPSGGLASIFSRGGPGGGRGGGSGGDSSGGGTMTSGGATGSGSTRKAKPRGSGQQ